MALHQYNKFQYNTAQYNTDARAWVLALIESLASTDSRTDTPFKALTDAVTSSDIAVKYFTAAIKSDTVAIADTLSRTFIKAVLAENLRLNDWCSPNLTNSSWTTNSPNSGTWNNSSTNSGQWSS